jgi:oligopeptide transport system permease protein
MSSSIEQGTSLWNDAFHRLKENRAALVSFILLATIIFSCVVLPFFSHFLYDPNAQILIEKNLAPSNQHWFGTDHLGRDIFSRVLYGGRISIAVAFLTTFVSVTIGVFWGAIAGYSNQKVDALMMHIVDILYALPFLVIVILLGAVLQPLTGDLTRFVVDKIAGNNPTMEKVNMVRTAVEPLTTLVPLFLAIGALSWLTISRIVRAQVQSVKNLEYVEAARSLGLSNTKILYRHILPNCIGPIIVYTTLTIPSVMLFEAVLSFLGLGVKPPNSSWGVLIQEGANMMLSNPWLLFFPGLFFCVTLLSLNFIGDGLRDALDPKSSKD